MAAGKQTPRQAMIGLMYLVLLAMLAMNASKDLLNAFMLIDYGITLTNLNLEAGNQTVFEKIQSSAALGSEKAVRALKDATTIKSSAKTLSETIKQYKIDLIEMGGGVDEKSGIPLGKENQDIGAEYMLVSKKGAELKSKIESYKKSLLRIIDPKDTGIIKSISEILATPEYVDYENNTTSWEAGISEHLPLVAVTANLSNLETYIQNAETQVLGYLYEGIALDTYKVNKILATSISKKSYVLQGEEYNAQVFLAAADTTQEPMILVGEYDTTLFMSTGKVNFLGKVDSLPVNGGVGNYHVKTEKTGIHSWGGIMKVPHPNPKRKGEFLMYPFESKYTVATPTAVISSEQLNIMYLKLDNEINVSAPGISSHKLEVSASNSCLVRKKENGKYIFKPRRTGPINISVYITEGGEKKLIATQKWIGKKLPKPIITMFKKPIARRMSKGQFKIPRNEKFQAQYSDDFPLTASVNIEECFVDVVSSRSGDVSPEMKLNNGMFNARFKGSINRFSRGDKVYVKMKVRGADGLPHNLSEIVEIR